MSTFWENISKFPRFLISVIIGFFLTTLYLISELLNNKKKRILLTITCFLLIVSIYKILKLMLAIN